MKINLTNKFILSALGTICLMQSISSHAVTIQNAFANEPLNLYIYMPDNGSCADHDKNRIAVVSMPEATTTNDAGFSTIHLGIPEDPNTQYCLMALYHGVSGQNCKTGPVNNVTENCKIIYTLPTGHTYTPGILKSKSELEACFTGGKYIGNCDVE